MAQDQSAKRLNIASGVVSAATDLWDAFQRLQELKLERSQAGNFTDAELQAAGSDLRHLTAFLVGAFLDTVITDLNTWFTDGAHPERRDYILQLRR